MKNFIARCGITALAVGMLAMPALAALTPAQAAMLRDAGTHLRQLHTNLKLAQDAAGPVGQPIAAARGRLAATRLGSVKDSVAQIDARLAQLPADDAEVKAFRTQCDAARAEIAALEARLANPNAAQPGPVAPPGGVAPAAPGQPAAGATVRLDYRQEQALKDAQFFLDEIEGRAKSAATVAEQVQKAADKQTLDHRVINDAVANLNTADTRVASVNTRLATLPPNGAGVAELAANLKKHTESLAASAAVIKPVHEMFAKALDPAAYPQLESDVKRLSELAQMFSDPQILQSRMDRAAVVWTQSSAAVEEAAAVNKKYALLVAQQTDHGVRVESAGKHFIAQHVVFSAAAKRAADTLPADIDQNLARIDAMVKEAVDEKKPAFFPGGIADQVARVKEKLALLAILAPAQKQPYADKLTATAAKIKAAQATLNDAIIQANELPPDRYAGPDKQQLIQLATDAWKKEDPAATVLAARIPSHQWRREAYWRYQSREWHKEDYSEIQVQLLVKRDNNLAEIRPMNLKKDHMQGDQTTAGPLFGKADPLGPENLMPLAKVK